ncbi:interleukin-22 receptor subunit alpha-2 [Oryzias melastigma]|uniref:interleukin-22 receptor subunit alpha-2 n=1 Tax=Oryzias melastigma TaxID=30732 RepID=UPI000CF7E7D6|nr:interleukin-22 receptor subunit alpha-2 [Oryzias melastigma]
MTPLQLAATVLLGNLTACISGQEVLAPPTQVRFNSTDFKNIVVWTPPTIQSSLQYYVQWKIYGEQEWLDVASCQGIPEPQCDLSRVTSEASEWYYARVHAASAASGSRSAWALSSRFSPRWETKISPPVLKLSITKRNHVQVHVRPPRALLRKMRANLFFTVFVINAGGEETEYDVDSSSNRLTLPKLKHKAKFCIQAQTILFPHSKSSARSPEKCITAP